MEGNLVIVESPAKAKTIQKFLGEGFEVKSSFGHIRDLMDNKLSVDVEKGFEPQYVIPAAKKKVVAELTSAAKKAKTVWLASDEDREGEAISWHLAQTLGLDPKSTNRIVFHEITKDAIVNAIQSPRRIDMNLVNAQQARRILDRLVGFEMSPVLWRKIKRGLSAGRVQSVALRLIVDKEKEIMSFKSEPYYRVDGSFNFKGTKLKGPLDSRFSGINDARKFLEDSIPASYSVDSIDKKESLKTPPAPFTTSTLQQEAGRRLHFPVSVTMRIAQSLYERGLITYMRTDSTNLSSLATGTAKKFICENFGDEYSHSRQYKTKSKGAQEAHEAIRPTYIANADIEGTAQEKKLYSLIWKRTVASQMSEAKVLNTNVKIAISTRKERYVIQAVQILFDGFLKLYGDDEENSEGVVAVPDIKVGDSLKPVQIEAVCKFTQPPLRYSEPSLVKKLEELGIGRPSTYAPTIDTLTKGRGYVVKGDKDGTPVKVEKLTLKGDKISSSSKTETIGAEKGKLLPQEIGMMVTDYLTCNFTDILDYDFTANVEKDFDRIANGELSWNSVIAKFYAPFHSKIQKSLENKQFADKIEKVIGEDENGIRYTAKFGRFGPYVQKGDGDNVQYASLAKNQLIETLTLSEAIKLFALPRVVGNVDGIDIIATTGRFGPYLKYGSQNVSIPKGINPISISLEECKELIKNAEAKTITGPLKEFAEDGISVLNGRYGPYIKFGGKNYRIPKGTDPQSLTLQQCKTIIEKKQ